MSDNDGSSSRISDEQGDINYANVENQELISTPSGRENTPSTPTNTSSTPTPTQQTDQSDQTQLASTATSSDPSAPENHDSHEEKNDADCDGGAEVTGQPNATEKTGSESTKTEVEEHKNEPDSNDQIENTQSQEEVHNESAAKTDAEIEGNSSSENQKDLCLKLDLPVLEGATAADPAKSSKNSGLSQSFYHIKWINFSSKKLPIITQNENGPCPLLAIMNVLLLKEKIKFAPMMELITAEQVMTYLGDCILESAPKQGITEMAQLNYEQNMHDAMAVIHKLQTGLDVNVKFTGVKDFEYTPECIIFDLLGISLYHGWLVDPQNAEEVSAVGTGSYNQLVEKIISQKNSDQPELVTEALVAESFLERTASQLTYHGLCELSSTTVKDNELCVFFRNNHFCTMHRHSNELFLLVTDQGFLTEGNVVWETLSNVEGDCHFVDANFRTYTKPEPLPQPIPASPVEIGSEEQIDNDYLLAMSLLQEQQHVPDEEVAWNQVKNQQQQIQVSDHELAIRLQEEEHRQAQVVQQQRQQQPAGNSSGRSRERERERERERDKDKSCCIL